MDYGLLDSIVKQSMIIKSAWEENQIGYSAKLVAVIESTLAFTVSLTPQRNSKSLLI